MVLSLDLMFGVGEERDLCDQGVLGLRGDAHLSVRKLVSMPKKRPRVKIDCGQTEEAAS